MRDDFSLGAIFAELAPGRQKWRRAIRVASITALGAGVMATMQIANPLGLTVLVNLSLPEAAFPLTRGVVFLFCAAVFQILAVAVAMALASSPALQLTAFVVLAMVTSYSIYAVPILGRLWLWIQVPAVTVFYMVLFAPAELVRDNTEMFAGMAIAVGLLLLFNNVIWPESAWSVLADSLVETIERSRSRFARLIAIAVGEAPPDVDRPVASQLGHHVAVLGQIHATSTSMPAELGRMLTFIMKAEQIRNQLAGFASMVLAEPGAFSQPHRASQLKALAGTLDEQYARLLTELHQQSAVPAEESVALSQRVSRSDLSARLGQSARDYPQLAQLWAATTLPWLDDDALEWPRDEDLIVDSPFPTSHGADPFLVRFAVRHTLALTIAFLLGLWDNSAALHAAIWLLMIGGPPSHGATRRKFLMRALGASGALALAGLGTIIISPNYTSLVPYLLAIFMGVLLMAYVGEGGGILSYLAVGGTAFVIAYSGPGPRSGMAGSLSSVWGISVGMTIRAAVSLIWSEHSPRTLAEEFQPLLAAMLELVQGAKTASSAARRNAALVRVVKSIQVMLGVASDALLEGRRAGIDPNNLIDALETLLRLAFVLGSLNLSTIGGESVVSLPVSSGLSARLEAWLDKLSMDTESGKIGPAPLRRMISDSPVPSLELMVEPGGSRAASPSGLTEADSRIINLTLLLQKQLEAISRSERTE